jgi:uncharacterized protein YrrD
MLRNINKLKGMPIFAADGEIGTVEYLFFDDEAWAIRYLVVNTGNWLTGRELLISPKSISHVNWVEGGVNISLTREQVEQSPDIDVLTPISRLQESALMNYYDHPYYWDNSEFATMAPLSIPLQEAETSGETKVKIPVTPSSTDTRIRSTQTVTGYPIVATDEEFGHVEDFVIDDESWEIRYLVIATRNWWPGKKVIIAPQWINSVNWVDSKVHIDLTSEAIKNSPEFNETTLISREYENQLYNYYGHLGYWQNKLN